MNSSHHPHPGSASTSATHRRLTVGPVGTLAVLGAIALLGTACAPPPPGPTPLKAPNPPVGTAIDRTAACAGRPWVGVLREPAGRPGRGGRTLRCPGRWQPVFASVLTPPRPIPPGLQRFCFLPGDPRATDPRRADLDPGNDFEAIERDCRIVGPAAETLFPPAGFATTLSARFVQQARGPMSSAPSTDLPEQARLVLVDSVQDDAEEPETRECPATPQVGDLECSRHGEILVRLARKLLCTDAGCAVHLTTRRVLRWSHLIQPLGSSPIAVELPLKDPAGTTRGGFSGTRQDLAQSIRREVETWWDEGETRPPLVLALPVGWEPSHAAGSAQVRAALRDAACRDVLVIAAAGNRIAGPPHLDVPLLPAAWEQEPAPTAQECALLLEDTAPLPPAPDTAYRPLIYAAGGVLHDGRPLSISRPGATPRLVAYGDHASVFYPGPPERIETLTGTSVSTVVIAAAAALHRSQFPNLAADDVMAELWAGAADSLAQGAVDFCLEPEANCQSPDTEPPRRVFVHPLEAPPASPWPPPFNQQQIQDEIEVAGPLEPVTVTACDPETLTTLVPLPAGAEPCPQRLYDLAAQPWVHPQPGANHNPDCTFLELGPGTLLLEFEPRYRVEGIPAKLSDLTLLVAGQAYRLSNQTLLLGEPETDRHQLLLTNLPFEDPPYPMYLAATVNGKYGTITPILQVSATDD